MCGAPDNHGTSETLKCTQLTWLHAVGWRSSETAVPADLVHIACGNEAASKLKALENNPEGAVALGKMALLPLGQRSRLPAMVQTEK